MRTKTKEKLTPRTAKTFDQICELKRDNLSAGDFWIMVGEEGVTLTAQRTGQAATASVTIPRRHFNRMVDFYNGSHE